MAKTTDTSCKSEEAIEPLGWTPFYENVLPKKLNPLVSKFLFSVLVALCFAVPHLLVLPSRALFYSQYSWLLATIIFVALLSLFIATHALRQLLRQMFSDIEDELREQLRVQLKVSFANGVLIKSGILFACLNGILASYFEPPEMFKSLGLYTLYFGIFLSGFVCGMAAAGIFAVVKLLQQLILAWEPNLDYMDPDRCMGLKCLGNTLFVFFSVTLATGVLISLYIGRVDWEARHDGLVLFVIWGWVVFPYVMAGLVVAVPAITANTVIARVKFHAKRKLKKEINRLNDIADRKRIELLFSKMATLQESSSWPFRIAILIEMISALSPSLWATLALMDELIQVTKNAV